MTTPLTDREDGDSPEIPHDSESAMRVQIRAVGTVVNPQE